VPEEENDMLDVPEPLIHPLTVVAFEEALEM
jgi:hypothetical protein